MIKSTRAGIAVALAVTLAASGACSKSSAKKPAKAATTTTTIKVPKSTDFTVAKILTLDSQFSSFALLAEAAGLTSTLETGTDLTLFAPSTQAFTNLGTAAVDGLKSDPKGKLLTTLSHHIVKGKHTYAELLESSGKSLTTIDGSQLPIKVEGQRVTVGGSTVVKNDINAKNGIVDVLDKVITTLK